MFFLFCYFICSKVNLIFTRVFLLLIFLKGRKHLLFALVASFHFFLRVTASHLVSFRHHFQHLSIFSPIAISADTKVFFLAVLSARAFTVLVIKIYLRHCVYYLDSFVSAFSLSRLFLILSSDLWKLVVSHFFPFACSSL